MSLTCVVQSEPGATAVLVAQGTAGNPHEVLQAVVEGGVRGTAGVVFLAGSLPDAFFDLSSGFAGEAMQKLVNYNVRAAIVLPAGQPLSARFTELAHEHRTHPLIRFFSDENDATRWLRA